MVENFIIWLATDHTWIMTILTVMSIARTVNKPLFAFLRSGAEATVTTVDNAVLDKVERSTGYKVFVWLLDYAFSVKPLAKKQVILVSSTTVEETPPK